MNQLSKLWLLVLAKKVIRIRKNFQKSKEKVTFSNKRFGMWKKRILSTYQCLPVSSKSPRRSSMNVEMTLSKNRQKLSKSSSRLSKPSQSLSISMNVALNKSRQKLSKNSSKLNKNPSKLNKRSQISSKNFTNNENENLKSKYKKIRKIIIKKINKLNKIFIT